MGFTTAYTSMFSPDIKQTQRNVAAILDIAGWTYTEAAAETGINRYLIMDAMMSPDQWLRLLDKAGRRSFDHDEDSA